MTAEPGLCAWGFHYEQAEPWPVADTDVEYPLDGIRLQACQRCAQYMEYFAGAVIRPLPTVTA